jgi:peptidoglycan/LPS O-acetylase OafA/YrhL
LDGVRALAVLGVIAFHTGLSWLPGGYYGVDAFFVLSGYLITTLLLTELGANGSIRLGRFWAGRARRLLPALFLLVAVIGISLAIFPSLLATPHIVSDALATIFYASNWYSIHGGVSYFSTVAQPSPLLHTWSLAIEEQFYLVWPLVVLGVMTLGLRRAGQRRERRRGRGETESVRTIRVLGGSHLTLLPQVAAVDPERIRRRRLHLLFAVASLGALGSALWMAVLAPSGYTTRAYYGTDTRAQALLIGASVAIGLVLWKEGSERVWFSRFAAVLGVAGIGLGAALWATVNESSTFAFSGGFLLASLAAGMVVLGAVAAPNGPAVRLLELPPLPQLGRISYGIYLWYWPVLLVMSGSRLHWGVYPLFGARVAVTVTIAALSARLVELPIRRGALLSWRSLVAAPVAAAAAIGLVFVSTLVPVGASLQGSSVVNQEGPPTAGLHLASMLSPPLPTTTTTTTTPSQSGTGTTKPIKVLLVGDSIAGSLGVGLAAYQGNDNIQLVNEGIPGCSLSMATEIRVLFYTLPPGAPCHQNNNPDSLFDQWQKWVNAYNPDVVVYVARGETFDNELNGTWQNLGEAAYDKYVENRYRQAVDVLGSRGATVVLMTTPYYDSGTSPSGTIWPEDATNRVVLDNQIIRQVASSETTDGGHQVYVFDLGSLVSPGNAYTPSVDGVSTRCSDGVHFTVSGGVFVGLQVLPDLAVLGRAHASASPGGSWPGHLPPSTPSWYPKLPCTS